MKRIVAISLFALGFFGIGQGIASDAADRTTIGQAAKPNGAPAPIKKLLSVEPVKGFVGDSFTITGDGLPAGKKVEFFWSTVEAAYATKVLPDNIEYHERKYDEKRLRLGEATVDPRGRVSARFTAPDDFGEVHDLYAVIDGKDVARGGFRILRSATITPTEGPVGTPITVTVKGLSWRGFEQFMALRYDNKYTEICSNDQRVFSTAPRPAGKRVIQLNNSTAYARAISTRSNRRRRIFIPTSTTSKNFVLSST
jgi:hypothetical protein